VAQQVERTGRSVPLEPMPPNERRVVHMALADYPGIRTSSTGFGDERRIVVEPETEG